MTINDKITAAQNALREGDAAVAETLYQEILHEEADNLCALDGLGIIRSQKGELSAGLQYFYDALVLLRSRKSRPADAKVSVASTVRWEATVLYHIALTYRTLGHREEALKILGEAAVLSPEEPDLLLNLGQLHYELEHYAEAIASFRSLTCVQPDNASAWLTLGYILYLREQYSEAAEVLHTAELLDDSSPDICLYLAESLRKAERFEESLPYYKKMLQVGNEYPQAVYGYGKALLSAGYLADGWDAMEFRFAAQNGTWERHLLPNWEPERIREQHCVLVYSEESISADIMYASCLPNFLNITERCVVECDPALHNLFKRSFPAAEIVPLPAATVDEQQNPWGLNPDSQIAFGSLPRYFRRDRCDFPLRKAYLVPDREKLARWTNKLHEAGDAKKIGILWQGHWTAETDKQTALPVSELRKLIANHWDVCWINLQNGSAQNALGQRNGLNPRLYSEVFQYDLDEMAAMLTALDLVITPPGYVANLAGALGVNTYQILPAGADWRHLIDVCSRTETASSVWHNTIKVFRQQFGQSWADIFRQVEGDLAHFLARKRPPELDTAVSVPSTIAFPSISPQRVVETRRRAA
ncbi:MAG: tetratricopeptide repeat protein [Planctomycetaceae bacterium]|jgi:tetratricopeptide (TPR) repeat protein|nr:tetratricopeptide repeat protein [Planctomycetaceae bacterium]